MLVVLPVAVMIWVLRQSEINTVKKGQDQLTEAFNNLSNKALLENQRKFMELAEDKFSAGAWKNR